MGERSADEIATIHSTSNLRRGRRTARPKTMLRVAKGCMPIDMTRFAKGQPKQGWYPGPWPDLCPSWIQCARDRQRQEPKQHAVVTNIRFSWDHPSKKSTTPVPDNTSAPTISIRRARRDLQHVGTVAADGRRPPNVGGTACATRASRPAPAAFKQRLYRGADPATMECRWATDRAWVGAAPPTWPQSPRSACAPGRLPAACRSARPQTPHSRPARGHDVSSDSDHERSPNPCRIRARREREIGTPQDDRKRSCPSRSGARAARLLERRIGVIHARHKATVAFSQPRQCFVT